jgi:membrane protein DedA with SNARE-associated domain
MDQLIDLIDTFWQNLQNGTLPQWSDWNYLILLLLVIVEGPIVTLLGGAAASAGVMKVSLVLATVALGNLIADLGWYALGYYSNVDTLLRYGRWLGLRRRHLTRLRWGMRTHAQKILLVAKFSAGFIIPTLIATGLARLPFRRWFPIVFAGEIFWTVILVLIGYHATQAIKRVEQGLHYLALGGAIVLLLLIVYLLRHTLSPTGRFALGDDEPTDREQEPPASDAGAETTMERSSNGVEASQQNRAAHESAPEKTD